MIALLLAVCVQGMDSSRRGFLRSNLLTERGQNATNASKPAAAPVKWGNYTADYCASFCEMAGVTPGKCTVCTQRLVFNVQEGETACQVACEMKQTDEITESVVDCQARKDRCMFKQVEPAVCKLECAVENLPDCMSKCAAFKASHRGAKTMFETFHPQNLVDKVTGTANQTKEVNGTNVTTVVNVTEKTVKGVDPLPVANPAAPVAGVAAPFRFHQNESQWIGLASSYCEDYYCKTESINSYKCVECVNRLNTSVETALYGCRVRCEMHQTDRAGSGKEPACDSECAHQEFEAATCRMECEVKVHQCDGCEKKCVAAKAAQRTGTLEEQFKPFYWPKASNGTNATNATA